MVLAIRAEVISVEPVAHPLHEKLTVASWRPSVRCAHHYPSGAELARHDMVVHHKVGQYCPVEFSKLLRRHLEMAVAMDFHFDAGESIDDISELLLEILLTLGQFQVALDRSDRLFLVEAVALNGYACAGALGKVNLFHLASQRWLYGSSREMSALRVGFPDVGPEGPGR